jgi:hypothetical protein
MAVSTLNGEATAQPSRKVLVCTAVTVLTPIVLRLLNRFLFHEEFFGNNEITGLTGFTVLILGYWVSPQDNEGVS